MLIIAVNKVSNNMLGLIKSYALCVDIRPLWGLFGPYKETNVRLLFLGQGQLQEWTEHCLTAFLKI